MKRKTHGKYNVQRYAAIGTLGIIFLWIGLLQLSLDADTLQHHSIRAERMSLPHDSTSFPFFRRKTRQDSDRFLSIVTHVSLDKLYRLEDLVARWEGPISCAVYAHEDHPSGVSEDALSSLIQKQVDIHLVVGANRDAPYPINVMRNVALDHADTKYIFAIDIDFIPSSGAFQQIKDILQNQPVRSFTQLWVVPAFERHVHAEERIAAHDLPETKAELMQHIARRSIEPFHVAYFAPGHGPTQFEKWYTSDVPYRIQWEPRFEPYVIAHRDGLPRYWDGFTGYGYNKLSWVMELNLAGYTFHVVPSVFLVHINHPGRQHRWPKSAMQSEYFDQFIPYLERQYPDQQVIDVQWV